MAAAEVPVPGNGAAARAALRRTLLERRAAFRAGADGEAAQRAVSRHLRTLLAQLEPACLGLYWPVRGEFSAGVRPFEPLWPDGVPYALPAAFPAGADGTPAAMTYRRWQGPAEPAAHDGCGLPTGDGAIVVPDVVLVPCVGFTDDAFRLGYGGGYFDRWLAANPGVTAVGVAWSGARLDRDAFAPRPHDRPLSLVLTEHGVAAG